MSDRSVPPTFRRRRQGARIGGRSSPHQPIRHDRCSSVSEMTGSRARRTGQPKLRQFGTDFLALRSCNRPMHMRPASKFAPKAALARFVLFTRIENRPAAQSRPFQPFARQPLLGQPTSNRNASMISSPFHIEENRLETDPAQLLDDHAIHGRTAAGQRELLDTSSRLSRVERRFLSVITGYTPLRVLLDMGLDEPGIAGAIVALADLQFIKLENVRSRQPSELR